MKIKRELNNLGEEKMEPKHVLHPRFIIKIIHISIILMQRFKVTIKILQSDSLLKKQNVILNFIKVKLQ